MNKARAYFTGNLMQNEMQAIQRAHDSAKKDNDFIVSSLSLSILCQGNHCAFLQYHERIPDMKTLQPLGKAILAKPIAPTEPMSARFKDLFADLVPLAVTQALSAFDVRKKAIVDAEVGRLREHTQLMNGCALLTRFLCERSVMCSILASLNLPAALDDAEGGRTLPESLRDKSAKVKAAGGVQAIDKMIADLPAMAARNREIIDEVRLEFW